jgi:hypothetical protein
MFAAGLAVMLVAGVIAQAQRAGAAVYWSADSLGRANLDGSMPFWPLPGGAFPAPRGGDCSLAIANGLLYWGSAEGAIGRATADGALADQAFIPGLGTPCGVAVGKAHIYWTDLDGNMIGRANLDGSGVEPGFIVGASRPCGVAVDAGHLYWANQTGGSIGRASIDGSGVEQDFVSGLGSPCGIDLGAQYIYWGDQKSDSIGRSDLSGGSVQPQLVRAVGEPWDVAVNAAHVYWANRSDIGSAAGSGIGRARLDGGEVSYDLIPDVQGPTGVALDDRVFSTAVVPRPSDYLRFGKLAHNRRAGTVELLVSVPARGGFVVNGPRIGWSIDKGNPPPWLGGTFRWKLKLWPGKKGPAAKRIRRQLKRTGRAQITLQVTYQQEGRLPLEASKRITFQRHTKRRGPT